MFSIRYSTLAAGLALAVNVSLAPPVCAHADPSKIKVAILIFNDVDVIDYAGPVEVLQSANFDVFTVAATMDPVRDSGDAFKLTPKYTFNDAPQADLIVIPGGGFEAAKDSATVAWIKRQSEQATHVMSVCNGAFSLANTGLLDGLKATTTANYITRLQRTFPQIKATPEERVVDNGKIVTTAGLAAGIDGALHMVDIMKGNGAGQSVANLIEYDWHPNGSYVRGAMADRFIPNVPKVLRTLKAGDEVDEDYQGNKNKWETTVWYTTKLSPSDLFAQLKTAYTEAYALAGPWAPNSFRAEAAGALSTNLSFDDREGHHWKGILAVEPTPGDGQQVAVRVAVNRAG